MAHIPFRPELPGILGPMAFRPETTRPLNQLAETLLRKESATFSCAERELVASYVSYLNQCDFCSRSHAAVADFYADRDGWAKAVWKDPKSETLSARTRALLAIAAKVQADARTVSAEDVARARAEGATDVDIHDTVLIAAAFCMFNRYVDGLATFAPPEGDGFYKQVGRQLAEIGYERAGEAT